MCLSWLVKNVVVAHPPYCVECRELPDLVLTALKLEIELRDEFVWQHCCPVDSGQLMSSKSSRVTR